MFNNLCHTLLDFIMAGIQIELDGSSSAIGIYIALLIIATITILAKIQTKNDKAWNNAANIAGIQLPSFLTSQGGKASGEYEGIPLNVYEQRQDTSFMAAVVIEGKLANRQKHLIKATPLDLFETNFIKLTERQLVNIGNQKFNDTFILSSTNLEFAKMVIDPQVCAVMIEDLNDMILHVTEHSVKYEINVMESNSFKLAKAIEIVVYLCKRINVFIASSTEQV